MIGSVTTHLGAIVGARNQTVVLDLAKEVEVVGKIIIIAEEVKFGADSVYLELGATGVEDVEVFSKSDPFLNISKSLGEGRWSRVYSTEHISNNLNPVWRGFEIPVSVLCDGDFFRHLKLEICELYAVDHEGSGMHKYIGTVDTNLNDILQSAGTPFPFLNMDKTLKRGYKDSGKLVVREARLIKEFSFLQYLQGNCPISLMVAIDFTASNGEASDPSSLHYVRSGSMNVYERAITAVGEILLDYDSDKKVPLWGFGAAPFLGESTSYCFP